MKNNATQQIESFLLWLLAVSLFLGTAGAICWFIWETAASIYLNLFG